VAISWQFIVIYLLGGALAGLSAGLLGIGGGLIIVPLLATVLGYAGFPSNEIMHVAVATSISVILFTSFSSTVAHVRHSRVAWGVFWCFTPGLIIGASIGAKIADLLPDSAMRIIFGTFVFLIASSMFKGNKLKNTKHRPLPKNYILTSVAVFIGMFCNILGMGGGSLIVPYLSRYQLEIRRAIATSAVCGFPTALTGVIALALVGLDEQANSIPGTIGYIYWIAFACMVLPSVAFAQLGARLAHRLPSEKLRRIFAWFLIIVGIDMLCKAVFDLFLNVVSQ